MSSGAARSARAVPAKSASSPPCRDAAGPSSSKNRDRGGSAPAEAVAAAHAASTASAQMIRLASSPRPSRAMADREAPPVARSRRKAVPSCASTRAAPSPFHHSMRSPPQRSSEQRAISRMAGAPPLWTGSSRLEWVAMGSPSGTRPQRARWSSNMGMRFANRAPDRTASGSPWPPAEFVRAAGSGDIARWAAGGAGPIWAS